MEQYMLFGAVVLVTALCGLIVVAGGIFLLAKGAIDLSNTAPATALSIEFRKQFKLNTQVPGIAFFVIGLCFVLAALYAATPDKAEPIDLYGKIAGVEGPVSLIIRPELWQGRAYPDGTIKFRFYPDVSILTVEAVAPGYEPMSVPIEIGTSNRVALPEFQLKRRIAAEIKPKPESIETVAFQAPAVTDTSAPAFGSPK